MTQRGVPWKRSKLFTLNYTRLDWNGFHCPNVHVGVFFTAPPYNLCECVFVCMCVYLVGMCVQIKNRFFNTKKLDNCFCTQFLNIKKHFFGSFSQLVTNQKAMMGKYNIIIMYLYESSNVYTVFFDVNKVRRHVSNLSLKYFTNDFYVRS